MKKSIIIMGSCLLVALVAGSVFAWGPGSGRGFGPGQNCQGYGGQDAFNDLSQDQKDEFTALRQTFIDETYELRTAKFQKQQEMRLLMETSDPDKAKLSALSQEITDLQKQVRDKMIDLQLGAKKISPELGLGAGFGRGRGKWSNRGGQRGCQGQGQGQGNGCYNN